jgi:hypothetical protein
MENDLRRSGIPPVIESARRLTPAPITVGSMLS